MSSPARQVLIAPEQPQREDKKKKRLKKRVVTKSDGRYLIYYEKK